MAGGAEGAGGGEGAGEGVADQLHEGAGVAGAGGGFAIGEDAAAVAAHRAYAGGGAGSGRVWPPEAGKARLTWSESTDPLLENYQIRGCAGPEYDKDHEAVVGTVPGGGAREFLTDYALVKAGAEACFRVYVLLSTGNERAGTPVTVTR